MRAAETDSMGGARRRRFAGAALSLVGLIVAASLAGCGGEDTGAGVGAAAPISVIVINHVPIPVPCTGDSLTFFEGETPVDIPYQSQRTVQVSQLFGVYQIGFQVNGWYWRSCVSPGNCPNPKNCQNPDNAGQVAVEIGADCSSATLQSFPYACDTMVPDAMQAVSVTLQSSSPCTVVVAAASTPLTPTDGCCSCESCTAAETPAGQMLHCQS